MQLTAAERSLGPLRHINHRQCHPPRITIKPTRAAQTPATESTYPSLYIAKFPLIGFEMIENLPPIFSGPAALHVAVIIVCAIEGRPVLFDFLPENPTDPLITARILSNLGVPGQARSRQLKELPRQRCTAAGISGHLNALERAREMQRMWDKSELKLFKRDCRHFVDALLLELM